MDAVGCALGQASVDIELICVDDASTDGSAEIVESVDDSRVRVLRLSKNGGTGNARNFGIAEARGTWIQFLDSDDLIDSHKCARQIKLAADAEVVVSDWTFIDFKTNKELQWPRKVMNNREFCRSIYLSNQIPIHAALLRREIFDRVGRFREDIFHEDWEFWVRAVTLGVRFKFISERLATYRVKQGSKSFDRLRSKRLNLVCLRQIQQLDYAERIRGRLDRSKRKLKIDLAVEYRRANQEAKAEAMLARVGSPLTPIERFNYRMDTDQRVLRLAAWLPGPRRVIRAFSRWQARISTRLKGG